MVSPNCLPNFILADDLVRTMKILISSEDERLSLFPEIRELVNGLSEIDFFHSYGGVKIKERREGDADSAASFEIPEYPELKATLFRRVKTLEKGEDPRDISSEEERTALFRGNNHDETYRQSEGLFMKVVSRDYGLKGIFYTPQYWAYKRLQSLSPKEVKEALHDLVAEFSDLLVKEEEKRLSRLS